MTETRTRRPLRYDAYSKAFVPLTDEELVQAGWVLVAPFTWKRG